jgi:hypothetical protein
MGFPQPQQNQVFTELGINTTAPIASGTLATLPTLGSTAQAITLGTPVQNALSYDRLLQVVIVVSSATTATIIAGVSSSTTPGTQTMVPSFTVAVFETVTIVLYVPAGYYASVGTTGTISATAAGQWQPV